MMGTEIFKIDSSWAENLTKTRVSILMTPTVYHTAVGVGGHLIDFEVIDIYFIE